jgi:hypothetical protein
VRDERVDGRKARRADGACQCEHEDLDDHAGAGSAGATSAWTVSLPGIAMSAATARHGMAMRVPDLALIRSR